MTQETILDTAARLTSKDRREDYGDATKAVSDTAAMWSIILGTPISNMQFCLCMVALKITRQMASNKLDNLVGIAGYARVAETVSK